MPELPVTPPPAQVTAVQSRRELGRALRRARHDARLTQQQLGMRLGVTARCVHRWEVGFASPRRSRRAPITEQIRARHPAAATELEQAFRRADGQPELPVPANPAAPPPATSEELELAVLRMADELEVVPGRLRAALVRLLDTLACGRTDIDMLRSLLTGKRTEQAGLRNKR